jgi:hypothetical protein
MWHGTRLPYGTFVLWGVHLAQWILKLGCFPKWFQLLQTVVSQQSVESLWSMQFLYDSKSVEILNISECVFWASNTREEEVQGGIPRRRPTSNIFRFSRLRRSTSMPFEFFHHSHLYTPRSIFFGTEDKKIRSGWFSLFVTGGVARRFTHVVDKLDPYETSWIRPWILHCERLNLFPNGCDHLQVRESLI